MTEAAVKKALDQGGDVVSMPPVLGEDCPIQALGHSEETYWFVNSVGEVQPRAAGSFKAAQLLSLFGGKPDWLIENFPIVKPSRGDQEPFSVGGARNKLMQACIAAGFFNPAADLRGPGVWSDEGGGLVIHCGDRVQHVAADGHVTGAGWKAAAVRIGDFIYPASKSEPLPAAAADWVDPEGKAETPADALLNLLMSWNWRRPETDALLVLGAFAAQMLPGALSARPILYLIGDSGSGKSSLFILAENLHGPGAIYSDDPTADGIKKHVKQAAMAVLIDEVEVKETNARFQAIIELARGSYSRRHGRSLRGGNDPSNTKLNAFFMFGSVQPPPMKPQDINRQVVVELDALRADIDAKEQFEQRLQRFGALGPALKRRMIDGWPALPAAITAYRRALIAEGHDNRGGDTYGTILACAWVMLHGDKPVAADAAATLALQLNALSVAGRSDAVPAHEQCWNSFLTTFVELWSGGARRVVGDILYEILDSSEFDTDRQKFRSWGIRIVKVRETIGGQEVAEEYVAIAPDTKGLREIFRATDWATGGWRVPLERLPGARRAKRLVRFGPGQRCKPTLVPVALLRTPDDDDAQAATAPPHAAAIADLDQEPHP